MHTENCSLHTAQCTVPTANCTLHKAHCKWKLPTEHRSLHTVKCILYTEHYTLQTDNYTQNNNICKLQTTHPYCKLNTAYRTNCALHAANRTSHITHCTLQTVHCTPHTGQCTLPGVCISCGFPVPSFHLGLRVGARHGQALPGGHTTDTVFSIHRIVYFIPYTVYSVRCTL